MILKSEFKNGNSRGITLGLDWENRLSAFIVTVSRPEYSFRKGFMTFAEAMDEYDSWDELF